MEKQQLSIDHPSLSQIKDSLNYAITLAVHEAKEGATSKVSLNMDITSADIVQDDILERTIEPIIYTCNVKTTKDINKDRDITDVLMLRVEDNRYYPYDNQISFDDSIFDEEEES